MGDIQVEVWDATGNKRLEVQTPDDVAVERIVLILAEQLHLPRFAPDGQLMSYKLHHRRLGKQLRDDQSLCKQEVAPGDVLRIQPEITAGGAAS
jgi:WXG100 protein secretion system (Wss), protein YukD